MGSRNDPGYDMSLLKSAVCVSRHQTFQEKPVGLANPKLARRPLPSYSNNQVSSQCGSFVSSYHTATRQTKQMRLENEPIVNEALAEEALMGRLRDRTTDRRRIDNVFLNCGTKLLLQPICNKQKQAQLPFERSWTYALS